MLTPEEQKQQNALLTGAGGDPSSLHVPSASGPSATVPKPSTSPATGAQTLQPPQPLVQPPSSAPASTVSAQPANPPAQAPGITAQNATLIAPGTAAAPAPAGNPTGATTTANSPAPPQPAPPQPVVQPPPPTSSAPGQGSAPRASDPTMQPFNDALWAAGIDPSKGFSYADLPPNLQQMYADLAGPVAVQQATGANKAPATVSPYTGAMQDLGGGMAAPTYTADALAAAHMGIDLNSPDWFAKYKAGQGSDPSTQRFLQNGVMTDGSGKALGVENGTGAFVDPATGELTDAGGTVAAQSSGATKGLPPEVNGVPIVQWMQQQGLVPQGSVDANGVLQPLVQPPGSTTGVSGAGGASVPMIQPPTASGVSGTSVTGTNGATPDSLSSTLLQKSQDLLNNPSVYDDPLFQQQMDLAKRGLDQQYAGIEDNLKADLSQRGLDWSTIAAGKLGDFATNKGNAWQNIVTQMLTDRAQGLAAARGQAFDQANAEQGYNANRDDTAFGRAVQLMQLQQSANAQNVAEQQGWAQLGLGALNSAQQNALLQATGAQNLSSATSDQLAQMAQLAAEFFGKANASASSTPTPMILPPGAPAGNTNQGLYS